MENLNKLLPLDILVGALFSVLVHAIIKSSEIIPSLTRKDANGRAIYRQNFLIDAIDSIER